MKKILIPLLLLFQTAFALSAQVIRDIDETVVLRSDGSAIVTQVWDVNVVSGTEFYLPFDNLGPMRIENLRVSENGQEFYAEGVGWDTDRTREQKRGRCGIVRKSNGVELCWGQGDYGDHVWTVTYTVQGLVMRMGEYNGLYFTFVNPGLAAPPKHVKVTLLNGTGGPEWTSDNVKVWGFRSDSEIYVENGAVRAESLSAFGRNSAMTVLVRFDPDLFIPAVTYTKDFEKVKAEAFEGSDYIKRKSFFQTLWDGIQMFFGAMLVLIGFVCSPVGLLVIGLIYWLVTCFIYYILGLKYRKNIVGAYKVKDWYRDLPLKGSIPAAYFALVKGDRMPGSDYSNNLIGAYFLRWVMDGVVTVLPDPSSKNRVNLSFEKEANFPEVVENDLYKMVREASGSNLILEAGEFEKWAKKSFKKVSNIPERETTVGLKWFQDRHYMVSNDKCTPEGQEQARHLFEFKNFLNDFTLSKDRGSIEAALWRDYLVYAALFGIADKVAKEFQKLYPGDFEQFTQTVGLNPSTMYDLMRVSNNISATAMRNAAAEKAARSSSGGSGWSGGGGGHFSSGGGGGSFGGSFGGGSR